MMKRILGSVAVSLGLALGAIADSVHGLEYTTSGEVEPAQWTIQYDAVLKKATQEEIPIVVFWVRDSCGYCKKLAAVITSPEVQKWHKDRGYLCLLGVEGKTDANRTIRLAQKGSHLPFVGVYWDTNGDGKPDIQEKWSGRAYEMPVTEGSLTNQYMKSVEKYLSGYKPVRNSAFVAHDTACDRLECEAGTKTVGVDLVRDGANQAMTEQLVITDPKGTVVTNLVDWKERESTKTIAIDPADFALSADGEQLTLNILQDGVAVATNHITYVVKENSAANPAWIGETLAFGKWTADIEGAKQFAKDNGGYTLVSIQGSMWCPDCANTDRNFLDLEEGGVNRFKAWATENKVMLVTLDIPNYKGPTVTDCASPTLFSKDAYATTLARGSEYPESGADAALTNAIVRSGLGYLSRKGISDDDAEKTLKKFHDLAYFNTDQGGFHRPEDGNKNRTGVPIFVLLKGDQVVARFTRFAAASPMAADQANFDSYTKRLDEMIALAETDPTEIANNYPSAEDGLVMEANGGELTSTLCNADFQDAVKLAHVTGMATQTVSIAGTCNAGVTVQLYRLTGDGKVELVGGKHICEKLSVGMSFTEALPGAGTYFALVAGGDIRSADFATESATENHFVTYTLSGATVYVPGDAAASGVAGSDGTATVVLTAGEIYHLEGIDASACKTVLEPQDKTEPHKLFRALVGGAEALPVLGGAGQVFSYQQWIPGAVGFPETEKTVPESVNDLEDDDWIEIVVARQDGKSGRVKARVSVVKDETTLTNYVGAARYIFASADDSTPTDQVDLVWDDGEDQDQVVRVQIQDDTAYDGDGEVVLKLEVLASDAGDVSVLEDKDIYTLKVTEDDKATPGRVTFTRGEPFYAKAKTVYVREGEAAKVWAKRIEATDGLLGVEVKSSLKDVTFSVENERDLTPAVNRSGKLVEHVLWWSHREDAEKYLCVSNVPAGKSAKITLNAFDGSKTLSSSNAVTVVAVAADAPAFAAERNGMEVYRYAAVSNTVAIDESSCTGGNLTFTKLSGTMPSGLKVTYDATTGAMLVSGVPTKAGVYTACYQVSEKRGTKTVAGLVTELTITVIDPAAEGSGRGGVGVLNDSCVKSRTIPDMMFLDSDTKGLGAVLTLTLPANGKASAKLTGVPGTGSFSAKNWSSVNPSTGDLMADLAGSGTFKGAVIRVTAHPDGSVDVGYNGVRSELYTASHDGRLWSNARTAEAYRGYYTAVMPIDEEAEMPAGVKVVREASEGFAPRGDGYLTFKLQTSSAYKAGKVTWAGQLPNGTSLSGTAVLTEAADAKAAYLPLVKLSSKDTFTAVAKIDRDAAQKASEQGEPETCFRAISVPELEFAGETHRIYPYWGHSEKSNNTLVGDYTVRPQLFGSIYDQTIGFDCCCEWFTGSTELLFGAIVPAASDVYGDFGEVHSVTVRLDQAKNTMTIDRNQDNPQKITLSYNRSTGIVSGTFKLPYTDDYGVSKTLSATYKGVVLLGWSSACGCGDYQLPFVSGAYNFTDKVTYTTKASERVQTLSVKRGGKVLTESIVYGPTIED